MSFVVDFSGPWNGAGYSRVRILDEGHQEGDSFVYKIEVLDGPLKDELDELKGGAEHD
jgi:hypothetical protein